MQTLHLKAPQNAIDGGLEPFLEAIKSIDGVEDAGPVHPRARNPITKSAIFVVANDDADLEEIVSRLEGMEGVRNIEAPALRYLPAMQTG